MSKYDNNNELRCCICRKPQSGKGVDARGVYMLDECVTLCQEVLDEEAPKHAE